jgi:threonine dehydrogenase-like Zn-dependent dehydrogenase
MKAVTYQGKNSVALKKVDDPRIQDSQDVVVNITSTAICGSDLHLYQGNFPLPIGYVIGHEPMGIVEEVGKDVTKVKKGDRVIVPFTVACGTCHYCEHHLEVNVIIRTPIMTLEDCSDTLRSSVIIPGDKRNISGFHTGTTPLF